MHYGHVDSDEDESKDEDVCQNLSMVNFCWVKKMGVKKNLSTFFGVNFLELVNIFMRQICLWKIPLSEKSLINSESKLTQLCKNLCSLFNIKGSNKIK